MVLYLIEVCTAGSSISEYGARHPGSTFTSSPNNVKQHCLVWGDGLLFMGQSEASVIVTCALWQPIRSQCYSHMPSDNWLETSILVTWPLTTNQKTTWHSIVNTLEFLSWSCFCSPFTIGSTCAAKSARGDSSVISSSGITACLLAPVCEIRV